MPIYEYLCQDCGESLEALQKLSDAPLVECPACHKPSLKKKVSAAAFRLKGGGWYETDFKTGNKKNLAGGAGAKDTGAASTSGDSAAASKDTSKASESSKPAAAATSSPKPA
jgi:putative FmdB family regulatory protein